MAVRDITEVLLGFARTLRHAGIDATPDRVQSMLVAVEALGGTNLTGTYWAGRLTLCAEPDDLPIYDAAFSAYFGDPNRGNGARSGQYAQRPHVRRTVSLLPTGTDPATRADEAAGPDDTPVSVLASDSEVLRQRDVAALSDAERAEVRRLIGMLAPLTAPRSARRYQPASRGVVDPHRTVRRILRHGGEPTRLEHRRRRTKPRRLVLLLDVSGSMTPYADALLRFGHAAVRRRPASTEVFTVGTRLTRITRQLRHRDPDAALWAASRAIPDWHGGTRLAEALKAFLDRWGQRGMAHGAVLVVLSDGWERGDPESLAEQVSRMARLAYRLVWVNPYRGKPGYEPRTLGMAAALPYLDDFVAGHSLASLEDLVEVIARA